MCLFKCSTNDLNSLISFKCLSLQPRVALKTKEPALFLYPCVNRHAHADRCVYFQFYYCRELSGIILIIKNNKRNKPDLCQHFILAKSPFIVWKC